MDGGQIEVEFMRWPLAWTVGMFQSERIPMPKTLKKACIQVLIRTRSVGGSWLAPATRICCFFGCMDERDFLYRKRLKPLKTEARSSCTWPSAVRLAVPRLMCSISLSVRPPVSLRGSRERPTRTNAAMPRAWQTTYVRRLSVGDIAATAVVRHPDTRQTWICGGAFREPTFLHLPRAMEYETRTDRR